MGVVARPRHMVHVLFYRAYRRGRPEEPFDPHSVFLYESGGVIKHNRDRVLFREVVRKGVLA